VFNNADLRVLNWSDDKVTVALPEVPQSGRLTLRQGQLESNGLDLTVVSGYREPPRITISNNTPFPISIATVPSDFGTQIQVELQPGESRSVRVLPWLVQDSRFCARIAYGRGRHFRNEGI